MQSRLGAADIAQIGREACEALWHDSQTWQTRLGTYAPRNESFGVTPVSLAFYRGTLGCSAIFALRCPDTSERERDIGWQRGSSQCNVCVFGRSCSMKHAAWNWTRLVGVVNRHDRAKAQGGTRSRAPALATLTAIGCLTALSGIAEAQAGADTKPKASASTSTQKSSKDGQLLNVVLFSTAGTRASIGPLDSVIQAALEKLAVVNIASRPGMDLNAVQLAIDCVSETPQCLRAVATQTQAQVLIAPSLQNTQSELVLSLLRFDTSDGQMRRVLRRQPGTSLKSETLDSVPSMLRELFNVPEPEPQPPAVAADTTRYETSESSLPPIIEPPQEPARSRALPLGPFLLAGGGALTLGTGAVFGAMFLSTNDDFNTKRVSTERDVSAVQDLKDKAKAQATIANVLYGVGGAMMIAGGIWLAVALSQPAERDDWQTAVVPAIAPGQLGFAIVHRGGAF